jgi:hypothetical protein
VAKFIMAEQRDNLLGESNSFIEVLEQVSRLAPLDKPVLIIGERGTGKELIANRLHYLSSRWQGRLSPSTVPPLMKICLIPSCLVMRREPSPARKNAIQDVLSVPMAAPCFLMNWPPPRCWYKKTVARD